MLTDNLILGAGAVEQAWLNDGLDIIGPRAMAGSVLIVRISVGSDGFLLVELDTRRDLNIDMRLLDAGIGCILGRNEDCRSQHGGNSDELSF